MTLRQSIRGLLTRARPANRGGAPARGAVGFADLTEMPEPALLPWLDRPGLDEATLSAHQLQWRRTGVDILPKFMPDDLIDAYAARREKLGRPAGYPTITAYLQIPELKALALYPPLMDRMRELIGEEMMLHLSVTKWISTERNWHQDDYLNPAHVNCWYAAAWIAVDDIDPDAGPFEYIPGSHTWPLMRGHKVRDLMSEKELAEYDRWPRNSESFVVPAAQEEIDRRGQPAQKFIARRGDVLIWHGRLMHRGSLPARPGMVRKSLICHYSGLGHRIDMPRRETDHNGKYFAVFDAHIGRKIE